MCVCVCVSKLRVRIVQTIKLRSEREQVIVIEENVGVVGVGYEGSRKPMINVP